MKKRLILYVAAMTVMFSIFTYCPISAANPYVKVVLGERQLELSQSAMIVEGRTLVPLRGVFEAMGADVDFKAPKGIVIERGMMSVYTEIGSDKLSIGGIDILLDVPSQLIDGATYVPLRAITESLGADVDWVEELRTVIITEAGKEKCPDPEIILYSEHGDTVLAPISKAKDYENYGWFLEKQVTMYSLDGRTIEVPESEVSENKTVGWYTSPPLRLYSYDGRYTFCSQEDVAAYEAVGWFTYDGFLENTEYFLSRNLRNQSYYNGYKYIENIVKNFDDSGLDKTKIEEIRIDYINSWRDAIDATIAIVEYEVVTNYEGRKQANITLMNLSKNPVNSFELKFSCRDEYGALTTDSDKHDGTITGWSKKANIPGYSKKSFGWVLANNSKTVSVSDFELTNVNE